MNGSLLYQAYGVQGYSYASTEYKGNANLKSGIAETSTIFQLRNESAESIKARNMQKAKTYWLTEYIAKE